MRVVARGGPIALALLGGCYVENPAFVETSRDESGDDDPCSPDAEEPDDDEIDATPLGPVNDDAPSLAVDGRLEEATAQDWFVYVGEATSGLTPQPRARVTSGPETALGLCIFFECAGGAMMGDATCVAGEHAHTMETYRPGCCANDDVIVEPSCTDGVLGDMTVFVRVSNGDAPAACVDYVLGLEF